MYILEMVELAQISMSGICSAKSRDAQPSQRLAFHFLTISFFSFSVHNVIIDFVRTTNFLAHIVRPSILFFQRIPMLQFFG